MRLIAAAALTLGLFLFAVKSAGQTSDRPNFTGTWSLDKAKSDLSTTKVESLKWVIEQAGPDLKFAETAPDGKVEFNCKTTGKECEVPSAKEPLKISMYFNGPALVQFHRAGSNGEHISKRQWQLSEDKKSLQVEVTYIVPDAKPEKLVFVKQ
jgi:hypothetical protein